MDGDNKMKKYIFIIIMSAILLPSSGMPQLSVTTEIKTLSVKDATTASKLPVMAVPDAKASYDSITKQLTFTANKVGDITKWSWILIHDGVKVIDLMYTKGTTETIYKLFEADTANKCLDEIARLNLIDNREVREEDFVKIVK